MSELTAGLIAFAVVLVVFAGLIWLLVVVVPRAVYRLFPDQASIHSRSPEEGK